MKTWIVTSLIIGTLAIASGYEEHSYSSEIEEEPEYDFLPEVEEDESDFLRSYPTWLVYNRVKRNVENHPANQPQIEERPRNVNEHQGSRPVTLPHAELYHVGRARRPRNKRAAVPEPQYPRPLTPTYEVPAYQRLQVEEYPGNSPVARPHVEQYPASFASRPRNKRAAEPEPQYPRPLTPTYEVPAYQRPQVEEYPGNSPVARPHVEQYPTGFARRPRNKRAAEPEPQYPRPLIPTYEVPAYQRPQVEEYPGNSPVARSHFEHYPASFSRGRSERAPEPQYPRPLTPTYEAPVYQRPQIEEYPRNRPVTLPHEYPENQGQIDDNNYRNQFTPHYPTPQVTPQRLNFRPTYYY